MQVIVVGCGKVGTRIASQLSQEGCNITVIDNNPSHLRRISDTYDVLCVEGDGASSSTLEEAGVGEADLVIAVTNSDEKNLLCCLISKKSGNAHTIARVRNPSYSQESAFFRKNFDLAMAVNPEMAAAHEIARVFRFPSAISIEVFAKGHVELITFRLAAESVLVGKTLYYIHTHLKCDVLVLLVRRGSQVIIPSGYFELEGGDVLSVVYRSGDEIGFFRKIGMETNRIRTVMIVGGGKVTYYLARRLLKEKMSVKIIEQDKDRCDELAELLHGAEIINGDGTDEDLLIEEGIQNVGGFVSLTGMDELNIMLSLYAKSQNPKAKLVTKITRIGFADVIESLDLGTIVNPKDITADFMVHYSRSLQASIDSNMEALYKLADGQAEVMEFHVKQASNVTGRELQKMKLKKNILIGKIYRSGRSFTPSGPDTIEVGDSVVLVAKTEDKIMDLEDILEG
ncbi:MAG: Trk system potassium transporter TrkA [Lachnospiraceae bacterium]